MCGHHLGPCSLHTGNGFSARPRCQNEVEENKDKNVTLTRLARPCGRGLIRFGHQILIDMMLIGR